MYIAWPRRNLISKCLWSFSTGINLLMDVPLGALKWQYKWVNWMETSNFFTIFWKKFRTYIYIQVVNGFLSIYIAQTTPFKNPLSIFTAVLKKFVKQSISPPIPIRSSNSEKKSTVKSLYRWRVSRPSKSAFYYTIVKKKRIPPDTHTGELLSIKIPKINHIYTSLRRGHVYMIHLQSLHSADNSSNNMTHTSRYSSSSSSPITFRSTH